MDVFSEKRRNRPKKDVPFGASLLFHVVFYVSILQKNAVGGSDVHRKLLLRIVGLVVSF